MGGCFSVREEEKVSAILDKVLKADSESKYGNIKVLLLGTGQSGKSTIIKQMKILNQSGYSKNERIEYIPIVQENLMSSIMKVISLAECLNIQYQNTEIQDVIELLKTYEQEIYLVTERVLSEEVYVLIQAIWESEETKQMMSLSPVISPASSEVYFLNEISRIRAKNYLPKDKDMLLCRVKTCGIYETQFKMDRYHVTMVDVGGQRTERKKWIHCFENIFLVIYFVAINEFDESVQEIPDTNSLTESLTVFQNIISSRWFMKTSFVIFFNKFDIFEDKITKVSFRQYHPDFRGVNDAKSICTYLKTKFTEINKQRLPIFTYITQATDTTNIQNVFNVIKNSIFLNSLKDMQMI